VIPLTDLNVGDEVRYRTRFASSGRTPCRIFGVGCGHEVCRYRQAHTKSQWTAPCCVNYTKHLTNQESSLESVETSPAAGERLPRLRSQRRGFNIGHPSPTGPLPAAA
jgi:hypothetical protein